MVQKTKPKQQKNHIVAQQTSTL